MKVKLSRRSIKIMLDFTSSDALRPAMQGIHFDLESDEEPKVIATDGHTLAALSLNRDRQAERARTGMVLDGFVVEGGESFTAPASILKDFGKGKKSEMDELIEIVADDKTVSASNGHITLSADLIDEPFPSYKAVLPNGEFDPDQAEPPTFNAAFLAKFSKVATALDDYTERVCLSYGNPNRATAVHFPGIPHFFALIMPVMKGAGETSLTQNTTPSWVTA